MLSRELVFRVTTPPPPRARLRVVVDVGMNVVTSGLTTLCLPGQRLTREVVYHVTP